MGAIVWGILVIVICPLLQIPVIVYIARHLEVESDTNQTADANTDTNADSDINANPDINANVDASRSLPPPTWRYWPESSSQEPLRSFDDGSLERTDSSKITCPHCGTENDRYYTYCRNCVARLPTIGAR